MRHFAAHADALAEVLGHLDYLANTPEYRRVIWTVIADDLLVAAIYAKQILDQIVGPDGKEIHDAGELSHERYDTWNLDHHAENGPPMVRKAFLSDRNQHPIYHT